MNQKWMRILSWITVIALIFGLVFYGVRDTWHRQSDPAVTKGEWLAMLKDQFGVDISDSEADPDAPADGEYLAVTGAQALDIARGIPSESKPEKSSQELEDIAIEKKLLKKEDLRKTTTKEEAKDAINKLLTVYSDPAEYPSYYEPHYKDNVRDVTTVPVTNASDDLTSFSISSEEIDIPSEGDILLVKNELGIAEARRITDINESNTGLLDINAEPISDITEVMDSISFSGAADFSYLNAYQQENAAAAGNSDNGIPMLKRFSTSSGLFNQMALIKGVPAGSATKLLIEPFEKLEDQSAIKGSHTTPYANFEIILRAEIDEKDEKKFSIITKNNDNILETRNVDLSLDTDGNKSLFENLLAKKDPNKKKKLNEWDSSVDFEGEVKIKIKNFSVTASGYYQWTDPGDIKNFVDVNASADISVEGKFSVNGETVLPLSTFPVPLGPAEGIVYADVTVSVVFGIDGEITFFYEVSGVHAGMNISAAHGFDPKFGNEKTSSTFEAKIGGYAGLRYGLGVSVLGFELADPSVDLVLDVKLEVLKAREGYEDQTPCMQLRIAAPVMKLKVHESDTSAVAKLANYFDIENDHDLIIAEEAYKNYLGLDLHIESEPGGKTVILNGLEKDVCTHKPKPKDVGDVLQEKLDEEVEKQQDTFTEMINRQIEEQINRMLWQSCYG